MTGANLAEIAYHAYAESTGGKTWDGRDMPDWGDLGEKVQTAWVAAAEAVKAATAPIITYTSRINAAAGPPPVVIVHDPRGGMRA